MIFDPKAPQALPVADDARVLTPIDVESNRLELLAPAKNAEYGKQAILHGADAVYIGGPAFGARASAGNSIEDIKELAEFAHQYHAQVFVALNTTMTNDELKQAEKLIWQIYEAGADALIIQDMGVLQLDLPPIALHASTQMDNRTPEKTAFLEQVGFTQVVLARELTLPQIRDVAKSTKMQLEFFIHGALCVSYSGLCNLSHSYSGRSANRGECSQMCRLPCNLKTRQGETVVENEHLLSLKDNNQTDNLDALINAGVRSFKIEGRLKDLSYVKNVTAHYRQQLDAILAKRPDLVSASQGRCEHNFTPDPEKSFNRGSTDYFVNDRTDGVSDFRTPKYLGEEVGTVSRIGKDFFEVNSQHTFNNGDGLGYFTSNHTKAIMSDHKTVGLRVNRADGNRLYVTQIPKNLKVGMELYRNHDQAFETTLAKESSKRVLDVDMNITQTSSGFSLTVSDKFGHQATVTIDAEKQAAQDSERSLKTLNKQLAKLGSTDYKLDSLVTNGVEQLFLPASALNGLRRDAIAALDIARIEGYQRPKPWQRNDDAVYPNNSLSFLDNVANDKAKEFYQQHGVIHIEDAYEHNKVVDDAPLMVTRHCLRFNFNLCPKEVPGIKADPMLIEIGSDTLKLVFDCVKCEMMVVGSNKQVKPNAS
ncbi:collagenase-like protease [Alteromonadales bacterium alter-6D02]|nr:collagenase-like protease [Alteromonadales bacterium alter-6D02]